MDFREILMVASEQQGLSAVSVRAGRAEGGGFRESWGDLSWSVGRVGRGAGLGWVGPWMSLPARVRSREPRGGGLSSHGAVGAEGACPPPALPSCPK